MNGIKKLKRPQLITWICRIGFGTVVFIMPEVFSPTTRALGIYYPALFALFISLRFIAYVGIWHMKRWGVELLMIAVVGRLCYGLLLPEAFTPNPIGIVYHAIIIGALCWYYRRLDRNL